MYAPALKSLIRRDVSQHWALALWAGLLLLNLTIFERAWNKMPRIPIPVGGDSVFMLGTALFAFTIIAPILVAALLIVMLVHADPPHDFRADWRARPIGPLALLSSKAVLILAAIVAPAAVGMAIHEVAQGPGRMLQGAIVVGIAALVLSAAALTVAHLSTSRLQAAAFVLLAPLLSFLSVATFFVTRRAMMPDAPTSDPGALFWIIVPAWFVLLAAAPLYLVLARRKLGLARITFLILLLLTGVILALLPPTNLEPRISKETAPPPAEGKPLPPLPPVERP